MSADPRPTDGGEPVSLETSVADARAALQRARVYADVAASDALRDADARADELTRLRSARSFQVLVQQRRLVSAPVRLVRHPWRTLRNGLDWCRLQFAMPRFRPMVDHIRSSAAPLSARLPVRQSTDRVDPDQEVRWVGPVRMMGDVRRALFAHPNATVQWQVPAVAGTRIAVDCGIEPNVAPLVPHGIHFSLTVASADGRWTQTRARRLDPRRRFADRRWRPLAIDIPASVSGLLEVTLETKLPVPDIPDFAWALWGEPRIERPRSAAEVARLARAVLTRDGLVGTWRRLRHAGPADARSRYQRWVAAHTPTAAELSALAAASADWPYRPLISIITPVYNTDVAWLRACLDSVLAQAYPHWELCLADDASTKEDTVATLAEYAARDPRIKVIRLAKNGHISAASNAALDAAAGEFIALLDHDDELAPDALAHVVRYLNDHPEADFVYTDEDKLDTAGNRTDPYFKPDWSPEHFLNFMYTNHLMVLRRSVVERAGRFRLGFEGAQDYDLALRVTAETPRVGHVPRVLYHWRQIPGSAAATADAKPWALEAAKRALVEHVDRTGMNATVETGAAPGLFRVRRRIVNPPLVTLVITTDDRTRKVNGRPLALLPNLVRSIREKTTYANYELLIIDNGKLSPATAAVLARGPHKRVSYRIEGKFNFAHKLNFSARHATGSHLVILNDDVEVITPDWIESLLEYSIDPAVGAVGAKLFYPDGRLQHAGVVLGVCGVAAHVFHQAAGQSPGYFGSTLGPRNYSAVTGACLMTRREVFEQLGGFDERLAIDFNDVDYCLRVRRAGYRVVFTPHAELYHHESGSHGVRMWNPSEAHHMRTTWPAVIAADPYYNENLTREFPDYRVEEGS